MAAIALLFLVALDAVLELSTPASAPGVPWVHGRLIRASVSPGHATTLFLATGAGSVREVSMGTRVRVISRDGTQIAMSGLRPGDAVSVHGGTRVQDLSQVKTTLTGLVASPPDPDGDEMTVQITQSRTVLVSFNQRTRIADSHNAIQPAVMLRDATSIRMSGILDTRLDEMTETYSVAYTDQV